MPIFISRASLPTGGRDGHMHYSPDRTYHFPLGGWISVAWGSPLPWLRWCFFRNESPENKLTLNFRLPSEELHRNSSRFEVMRFGWSGGVNPALLQHKVAAMETPPPPPHAMWKWKYWFTITLVLVLAFLQWNSIVIDMRLQSDAAARQWIFPLLLACWPAGSHFGMQLH